MTQRLGKPQADAAKVLRKKLRACLDKCATPNSKPGDVVDDASAASDLPFKLLPQGRTP